MTLRPIPLWYYQQEAVAKALDWHLHLGLHKFVIELPTGSGKTRTALALASAYREYAPGTRILFITDRIDLVSNTVNDFLEFCDRSDLGVIWQDLNQLDRDITVVSKQTLEEPGRIAQLVRTNGGQPFSVVFIDECQGAATDAYAKIIKRVLAPRGMLVGLSATPYRSDGRNLHMIFTDGLCYSKDPFELMIQGYLADIVTYNYPTSLNLADLVLDGDYTQVENLSENLVQKLIRSNRYEVAYQAWRTHGLGKRTIFFGHTLQDAYQFRDYFVKQGVPCEVVEGRTSTERRREYYDKLIAGEIIISNFNVLTTGFNMKQLECIILGRVSDFRGILTQIIGRGTRICPEIGKTFCTLINLTGNNPVLCSMGLLPGHMDRGLATGHSLRAALTLQLEEEIGPLELVDKQINSASLQKVYTIDWHLGALRHESYDIFTGSGWKGDETTGLYSKACPPYGHIEVERYFMGHVITHVHPSGRRTQVHPTALPLREALARAQQEIVHQRERAKLSDGTSAQLTQRITAAQYTYLKKRNVPMPPPEDEHMLQSHYVEIERHIKQYGGAFTKEGGCIGFMQDRYSGEWVVARWAYSGSRGGSKGKRAVVRKQGSGEHVTNITSLTPSPHTKQKLASRA